jgi:RNA 2',3'-cyclic 3'-phosphodiesterase
MTSTQQLHRSFIALFPSEPVVNQLLNIQSVLRKIFDGVRWEKEDKFHFTLQFFGDQSEEQLDMITTEIQQVCTNTKAFPVIITKAGCFPNQRSPRIFWIGSDIHENTLLQNFVSNIQSVTQKIGIKPEEKPFHPHITVGRTKRKFNLTLMQKIESANFPPIEFPCKEIQIIKSRLTATGSIYTPMVTLPLS